MRTALFLFLFCTVSLSVEPVLDGVVARVNDDIISFSQLRAEIAPQERTLRQMLEGKDLADAIKEFRKSQINRMIDRLLLLQELKRQASPLPADATDELIDTIIKYRFSSDRQQWLNRLKPKATIKIY
jgi:hypothetical protein